MRGKLVIILASLGLALIVLAVILWFVFAGGVSSDKGTNEGGQISTEVQEVTKDEITTENFKSNLESVVNLQFYVKIADSIKESPYEGLVSTAIAKNDNVVVASLDVYEKEKGAFKVIQDIKSSNAEDFESESGKNFEKLYSEKSVVEQVGKTVLTINTDDSEIIKAILKAIEY